MRSRLMLGGVLVCGGLAACTRSRGALVPPSPTDQERDAVPAVPVALDHIILGIDSLERGIALLRAATGLTATYGGAHPGRGTQNALLALGSGRYLELLAPNPANMPAMQNVAAPVRELESYRQLTPVGWAFRVGDADSARATLVTAGLPASPVAPGARARPDGRRLAWRTVLPWGPVTGPAHDAVLPFAIAWSRETPHPATDAPTGCMLDSFTAVSPVADSIGVLLTRAGVSVRVRPGPREHLAFTLTCPRGRVAFP